MTRFRHAFTGATLDYPPGCALHADLVDSPLWNEQDPGPAGGGLPDPEGEEAAPEGDPSDPEEEAAPEGDPSDPEEEADDERPGPARRRRRRTAPGPD